MSLSMSMSMPTETNYPSLPPCNVDESTPQPSTLIYLESDFPSIVPSVSPTVNIIVTDNPTSESNGNSFSTSKPSNNNTKQSNLNNVEDGGTIRGTNTNKNVNISSIGTTLIVFAILALLSMIVFIVIRRRLRSTNSRGQTFDESISNLDVVESIQGSINSIN